MNEFNQPSSLPPAGRELAHQEILPNFEIPDSLAVAPDGYTSKQVVKIAGITYRQLDHWDRINFIKPSAKKAKGSGSRREYSYQDLLRFKVAKRLLDGGVSFQAVMNAFDYMENELGDDILTANLVIEGDQVSYARDAQEIVDLIQRGQGVLNMVGIPAINTELEAEVIALFKSENSADRSDSADGDEKSDGDRDSAVPAEEVPAEDFLASRAGSEARF